ncbi:cold shock domain-containing protein [candidate division KSB1 bacterium]|nr:cold shock domain-containing protein [candidate division KSB1 bacterium]
MEYGIVKSWDAAKGFGFITSEDDDDLFVHANDLDVSIRDKKLRPGQKVSFDIKSEFKGDKAVRVRLAK